MISWSHQIMQIHCEKLLAPPKPDDVSFYRWCYEMHHFGSYDATILRLEILYIKMGHVNKVAYKISGSPDVSIAFIGKLMDRGQIYAEFITRRRGTEIYIGATPHPEKVVLAKGMDIVQHRDTWAYTDGRRFGIQIQGQTYEAQPFSINEAIGIFLNIDDKQVSFYKEGVLQNRIFKLSDDKFWQIFVMLDAADDYVEISKFYFCRKGEIHTNLQE